MTYLPYNFLPPMNVEVKNSDNSSWIEPELDQESSNSTKLLWKTGVLKAKTGVEMIIIWPCVINGEFNLPNLYGYRLPGTTSSCSLSFDDMWSFINGVETGYFLGKKSST